MKRRTREDSIIAAVILLVIAIVFLAILARPARAEDAPSPRSSPARGENKQDWTTGDTVLQLTYTTLHVLDWAQTLHIARNPDDYYEKNRHLGQHPSEGKVNTFFAATLVANTAISIWLPKPYRTGWQLYLNIERAYWVRNNHQIGIKIHF